MSLDIDRTDDIDQLNDFVERYDLVNTLGANVSVWFSNNMFRARYKDDAEVFVDFQSDSLSWRRLKGGGEALVRAIGANRRCKSVSILNCIKEHSLVYTPAW